MLCVSAHMLMHLTGTNDIVGGWREHSDWVREYWQIPTNIPLRAKDGWGSAAISATPRCPGTWTGAAIGAGASTRAGAALWMDAGTPFSCIRSPRWCQEAQHMLAWGLPGLLESLWELYTSHSLPFIECYVFLLLYLYYLSLQRCIIYRILKLSKYLQVLHHITRCK